MKSPENLSLEPLRVLVVEDDRLVRWVLMRRLRDRGALVMEAESAEEAIQFIGRQTFDIVVSDIVLPGADGVAVLKAARTALPDAVVLLMTAHDEVMSHEKARNLGATDLIIKRPDLGWVAEIIDAVRTHRPRHQNSMSGQA